MKTFIIVSVLSYLLLELIIIALKKTFLYAEPSFITQTTAVDNSKPEDDIQKKDLAILKPEDIVRTKNDFNPSTSTLSNTIPSYSNAEGLSKDFKLKRFKPKMVFNSSNIKTKSLVTKIKIKTPAVVKDLIESALKEKNSKDAKPFVPSNNFERHLKTTDGTIMMRFTVVDNGAGSDDAKAEEKQVRADVRKYAGTLQKEEGLEDYKYLELLKKAEKLKEYAIKNGYSTEYGFFINMGIRSGKKRFFIIDLSLMTIVDYGMVTHGRGKERFTLEKTYSNEPGSYCTSLGIYKIGKPYTGMYGDSYKLHGLQQSNNNAYKRSIVLHSLNSIPDDEIDYPIFQSEGCPAVSPVFLREINSIVKKNSKPVLLWIFDTVQESQSLHCRY